MENDAILAGAEIGETISIKDDEFLSTVFKLAEKVNLTTTIPINTGKHVYKHWTCVMEKRGALHPLMDPFKMEANKDIIPDYSEDMCPKTLDVLSRTVYIGLNPDMDEATIANIIAEIRK